MKKSDVVGSNVLFSSRIKLPALNGDQLYEVLSAKADLSWLTEEIEKKADQFRFDTKPAGIDEYEARLSDPQVKEWFEKFSVMRARLFNEEFEERPPSPAIDKSVLSGMCESLTPGEASLTLKYLVKQ